MTTGHFNISLDLGQSDLSKRQNKGVNRYCMQINLKEKVALVTGSSKGIGKAIAYSLAKAEAIVIIAARGKEELENTAKEFREEGFKIYPLVADFTKKNDIKKLVLQITDQFRAIDRECSNP